MKTTKILFSRDFRSAATGEKAFTRGSVGEFPADAAEAIISEGAGQAAPVGAAVTGPDQWADLSGGQLRSMAEQAQRDRARNATAKRWARQ